jgi:hypothetical protein
MTKVVRLYDSEEEVKICEETPVKEFMKWLSVKKLQGDEHELDDLANKLH